MRAPQNLACRTNPVIAELQRRRELLRNGQSLTVRPTRVALVVEGGGMRGVVSGGALMALERLGLSGAFDEVHAESAGAINASYFLAGQTEFGSSIYRENLSSLRFVNPFRVGRILNVDYAIDEVVGKAKRLDTERVRTSPSDFFISLTDTAKGVRRVIDVRTSETPLLHLLKATSAIVPLYNHPVMIEGVPCADGGIADPIPVRGAIERHCTHILVLLTRPPEFQPQPFSPVEQFLADRFLASWNKEFVEAFYTRWQRLRYSQDLAFGRIERPGTAQIAVICPSNGSPPVSRITTNPRILNSAMLDICQRTVDLFAS